ncbi:MAG: hypothetical protein INQ03_03825 [Candidatus Heimdallarchaeota archaeon]|nr:hypothetical protein [Candidatus Heimdallarchaeota archaeon]
MRGRIILALLIGLLVVNSASAEVTWNIGEIYTFTINFSTEIEIINEDGAKSLTSSSTSGEVELVIDDIDEDEMKIYIQQSGGQGGQVIEDNNGESYDATEIGADLLSISATYSNDGDHHITNLYISLSSAIFVEPEWDDLNEAMKVSFEEYLAKEIHSGYTFEDLFDESKVNIMGKDNVNDALDEFTDVNKWSIEVDASGIIDVLFYDLESSEMEYITYDTYTIFTELEFDNEGVLKSYHMETESEYTTDYGSTKQSTILNFVAGSGLAAAVTAPGLSIPLVFSAMVAVMTIKRKEGRK